MADPQASTVMLSLPEPHLISLTTLSPRLQITFLETTDIDKPVLSQFHILHATSL